YPAPPELSTLSLHDALPISSHRWLGEVFGWPVARAGWLPSPLWLSRAAWPSGWYRASIRRGPARSVCSRGTRDACGRSASVRTRSEEHTSELQSLANLVGRP